MGLLQLIDAIDYFPRQRFFIDIGEQNTTSKKSTISIDIEEILGIENDGLALFLRGERMRNAAHQSCSELLVREGQVQADPGEREPEPQFMDAIRRGKLKLFDRTRVSLRFDLAQNGAPSTVLGIGQGDRPVMEFDQQALDQILQLFDVDEKRTLLLDPELRFRLQLLADGLMSNCGAGRIDGLLDL